MLNCRKIFCSVKREVHHYSGCALRMILAAIASVFILIFGWTKFGGPCRTAILFRIPGGGLTIGLYYVLWFIMFALFGIEIMMHLRIVKWIGNRIILLHIVSHMFMFLWYPLFFASFSQFLAFLIIAATLILLLYELWEMVKYSSILSLLLIFKIIVIAVYTTVNLSFMIIN